MAKNDACKNCGSYETASSNEGSIVCTGCGDVKESTNIVSEISFGGDSSVVGTFVSATRRPSSSYRSLGGRDSRAQSLEQARRRLDEIATSLRIRPHLVDSAQRSFELAMEHNFTKGRKTKLVAASCLYVVCRRERTPHLLIDFSEVLEINVFVLAHTFVQLIKLLNIRLPIVDPGCFIQRFASALEFDDQVNAVATTANKLVARMKRDWMSVGRKPSGICGAALYIAAKIHGFNRSMKEIVFTVKIGESTLISRLEEFRKTPSASLKFEEFTNMDLEDECDPPSFTRNRQKEAQEEERKKLIEEKLARKEKRRLKRELKLKNKSVSNGEEEEEVVEEETEQVEEDGKKRKNKSSSDKKSIKKLKSDQTKEKDVDVDDVEDEEEKEVPKTPVKINKANFQEEIEKESNDIVKQTLNITDPKEVDKIPTTLLENIEKFEQIEKDKQLQNFNNNAIIATALASTPTTTSTQLPTTDENNTTTTTTTATTTASTTQEPDTTQLATQNIENTNTTATSQESDFTKTMASQVSYPPLPNMVDPSVFLPDDALENLSDDELDVYLERDVETVKVKEQIWVELNKEWIEKNAERQKEIEEDIKAGRPPRKRKQVTKKSAENAAAAAEEELTKRTRNAKLVEKLGLFKPNFASGINSILGGGGKASGSLANALNPLQSISQKHQQSSKEKETQQDDDEDEDIQPQKQQSGSLLSQTVDNYGDYDDDY